MLLVPLHAQADYLYVAASPNTIKHPPLVVGGKGQIVAVIPQVRTAAWSLWEVWGSAVAKPAKIYYAVVLRQSFPGGKWLWTFKSDSDLWFKYLQLWAAEDATVQGPIRLFTLQTLPQVQCEAVALRTLAGITTDAGTPRQPNPSTVCTGATDAGVPTGCSLVPRYYPDGSILRCGTTGGWYLRQWKFGGMLQESDPDPGASDDVIGTVVPVPPVVGVQAGVWEIPPAPTNKTCTVPFGTACP